LIKVMTMRALLAPNGVANGDGSTVHVRAFPDLGGYAPVSVG
jgi:hypothetical protein